LYILGFIRSPILNDQLAMTNITNIENEVNVNVNEKNDTLQELGVLLQHVQIHGQHMTAEEFVNMDSDAPSFDEWNDNGEDPSSVNIIPYEDDEDHDLHNQNPPNLAEALDMIRRLHVLSSTDYPELYSAVSELESKLIDIYLEKKTSKQSSIYDYFSRK
jgi:hypothetical protein